VHDYDLAADGLVEGLARVASRFSIPMGITWVDTPAKTPLTLHWNEVTVEQILETITQTQAGFEMRISNGVVHVSATTVPAEQNFLLVRVASFAVHHQVVQMAQRELRQQVQSQVAPPKAGRGGIGGSLATHVGEPEIDVEKINDATVQDVLDALAIASTRKIWVVTFSDDRVPTATGFRRTLTLWNNYPIPDDQQPLWDMFGWDESIPSARLAQQ
jgi:hypothetical protein